MTSGQPGGGVGQAGSGCQFGAGSQLGGAGGQPGGGLKRRATRRTLQPVCQECGGQLSGHCHHRAPRHYPRLTRVFLQRIRGRMWRTVLIWGTPQPDVSRGPWGRHIGGGCARGFRRFLASV